MNAQPKFCRVRHERRFFADHVHRCDNKEHRGPHRCKDCGWRWIS